MNNTNAKKKKEQKLVEQVVYTDKDDQMFGLVKFQSAKVESELSIWNEQPDNCTKALVIFKGGGSKWVYKFGKAA